MKRIRLFSLTIFIVLFAVTAQVFAHFQVSDEIVTAGNFLGRLDVVAVNSQGLDEEEIVIGLRESNGDLKLKEYRLQPVTEVLYDLAHVADNDESGESLEIAMDSYTLNDNRFVTAVRTGGNRLKVVAWDASGNSLIRLGDSGNFGPLVNDVAISMISHDRVMAAYRTNTNRLGLRVWDIVDTGVNSVDFQFTDSLNLRTSVLDIDIDQILWSGSVERVMVGVRNGTGNLQVLTFDIDNGGNIQHLDSVTSGKVFEVRVRGVVANPILNNTSGAITASRNSSGNLHLTKWNVAPDGTITWASNNFTAGHPAGGAMNIAITKDSYLVTAFRRTSDSKLGAIRWSVENDEPVRDFDIAPDMLVSQFGRIGLAWSTPDNLVIASQTDNNKLRVLLLRD